MNTSPLKSFATSARVELLREVRTRITAVLASGSAERVEQPGGVAALQRAIVLAGGGDRGAAHVADRVAYTWFNRVVALRFMDAHGYTGIGVVSPAADQIGQPEVLAAAKRGQIDGEVVGETDAGAIAGLLSGSRRARPGVDAQAEAYALLIKHYCHHWHRVMPFMFEPEGDYTELLIPANLLAEDSVLNRSVRVMTEEVCQDVEVIGWLYQFYISERKDEVFAGFRKGVKAGAEEIPAATQLFTPHWIVRYLVENSVGRLWMLNHPESRLVDRMDYYIAPVDEEADFLEVATPEALTIMDPACGSGHMLTYAFDLLSAIYEEEGYTPSQIPSLILTNNLFGTEIDPRAGALAAFALTMKAAAKRKLFLRNPVVPRIRVLDPISFGADELSYLVTADGDRRAEAAFWNAFTHADTFGSLIRPDSALITRLDEHLATLTDGGDLFRADALDGARQVIDHATYLGRHYAVVIANPPYMGSKQMNALLSQFMKDEYPTGKSDLMTAFMLKAQVLTKPGGTWGMINLPSWMSLKSFEDLRHDLLREQRLVSMVHLGRGVFGSDFGSVAFVVANKSGDGGRAVYRRLFEKHVDVRSVSAIEALFLDRDYNRFEVAQSDFAEIPGSPIVYWLSEKMRGSFATGKPLSEVANLRQGLATADNNRFLRQWWEVATSRTAFACTSREEAAASGARWFPYNKGGEFRKWYGNQEHLVNWENDGEEICEFKPRSVIRNPATYFSPSVSWSDIGTGDAAFRRFPAGFIHDVKGMSAFGDASILDHVAVLMNSSFSRAILQALAPTVNFQIGDIGKVPVCDLAELPTNAASLVATAHIDWDDFETSWGFTRNPIVERSERG